MKTAIAIAFFSLAISYASTTNVDMFGSGANTFSIDFVTIGNPGNAADTKGGPSPPYPTGSVGYAYNIGKYEISEQMIDKANAQSTLGGYPLNITKDTRDPDKPATNVNWFEAAKFVNWLNTSTNNTRAYKFDGGGNFQLWTPIDAGYNPNNLAYYFLPSVDEWYKAAYHAPNGGTYFEFLTGSDTPPTAVASGTAVYDQDFLIGPADITLAGGLSPYGTMAQGDNVWEWEETDFNLVNDSSSSARFIGGGFWGGNVLELPSTNCCGSDAPSRESFSRSFRVASVFVGVNPPTVTDAVINNVVAGSLIPAENLVVHTFTATYLAGF